MAFLFVQIIGCSLVEKENNYLKEHLRAKVETTLKKVKKKCARLNISDWVSIAANSREISLMRNEEGLWEISKLDGCYVLKTDLLKKVVSKEMVHNRYKDLSLVERTFCSVKTTFLEVRPVYLRLEERTRGYVFVAMLAYRIIRELKKRWQTLNITVEEGIKELTTFYPKVLPSKGIIVSTKKKLQEHRKIV